MNCSKSVCIFHGINPTWSNDCTSTVVPYIMVYPHYGLSYTQDKDITVRASFT